MEQIPEKFMNSDGTLNTDALMKSYSELEKKIGTMVSIPDESADPVMRQKFNKAIGVPDDVNGYPTNHLFDDESVRDEFFKIGLTSIQVEKIYSIAENFLSPVLSDVFQKQNEANAVAELKSFFGDEDKMNEALKSISAFGEKFLPAEAFESLCATPQGIQSVYKMMQSMEPKIETEKNAAENFSDDQLRRMMRDPKYWREQDPEYIRKIETGFKKLYS